jgi:hypothetical protein
MMALGFSAITYLLILQLQCLECIHIVDSLQFGREFFHQVCNEALNALLSQARSHPPLEETICKQKPWTQLTIIK